MYMLGGADGRVGREMVPKQLHSPFSTKVLKTSTTRLAENMLSLYNQKIISMTKQTRI